MFFWNLFCYTISKSRKKKNQLKSPTLCIKTRNPIGFMLKLIGQRDCVTHPRRFSRCSWTLRNNLPPPQLFLLWAGGLTGGLQILFLPELFYKKIFTSYVYLKWLLLIYEPYIDLFFWIKKVKITYLGFRTIL